MRTKPGFLVSVLCLVLQSAYAQISWQRVWGPVPVTVEAIAFETDGYVFAATSGVFFTGQGIIRSTDNGNTWSSVNAGLADTNVSALLAASNGNLFAGVWRMGGTQTGCVYRSHDHGDSWARVDSGLSESYVCFALTADSTGDLFAGVHGGGRDVCRSTDNGDSWVPTTAFTPNGCQALAVHPNGTLFAGTLLTGMFRTSDAGLTWEEINDGLTNKFVYELLVTTHGVLFAGTGGFLATGVFRSTDRGTSWEQTALDSAMIGALALSADGTIFAGTRGNGVFASTDNGDHWVEENSGLTSLQVTALALSPEGFLFAGTDSGGLFRSANPLASVNEYSVSCPVAFWLAQNYPNPFNPSTTITCELSRPAAVRLSVHDLLGREVAVLMNERKGAGVHEARFNAAGLASGAYLYRLAAGDVVLTRKLVLLR